MDRSGGECKVVVKIVTQKQVDIELVPNTNEKKMCNTGQRSTMLNCLEKQTETENHLAATRMQIEERCFAYFGVSQRR